MAFLMRFISTDKSAPTTAEIVRALNKSDRAYGLGAHGELLYGGDIYALFEVFDKDDEQFEEEIEEFLESLDDYKGDAHKQVRKVLKKARWMVVLQVLFANRETETVLNRIDPIWQILANYCDGLLQVDGEGFYEAGELILAESL
ncbi:MAG: hypothetical protein JSS65_14390 [Armatimonadetes bacterium]|nr:hypothetical protein [Armatimonadota bacterium]